MKPFVNRTKLHLTYLETRDLPSGTQILAIAEDGGQSRVAVYTAPVDHVVHNTTGGAPDFVQTQSKLLTTFKPYPGFGGGVRIAIGDVTGDGIDDVVTAPGFGGGPHIKVYDGAQLLRGHVQLVAEFYAFGGAFRGGEFVAIGQMDPSTPAKEIIVGAGESGGPHVRIFALDPILYPYDILPGQRLLPPGPAYRARLESEFFAFDANFRGGVRVAAGDVNGDGRDEVIAAAGPGGGPDVRVFDVPPPNSVALYGYSHKLVDEFYAYDASFHGGVYVAAGDLGFYGGVLDTLPVDGGHSIYLPSYAEIITGPGEGGGPDVRVFSRDTSSRYEMWQEAFLGSADSQTGARIGLVKISGDATVNGIYEYPRPTVYVGFGAAPPSPIGVGARPYGEYRIDGLDSHSFTEKFLGLPPGLGGDPTQGLFVGV
jgi:hypothetical protein